MRSRQARDPAFRDSKSIRFISSPSVIPCQSPAAPGVRSWYRSIHWPPGWRPAPTSRGSGCPAATQSRVSWRSSRNSTRTRAASSLALSLSGCQNSTLGKLLSSFHPPPGCQKLNIHLTGLASFNVAAPPFLHDCGISGPIPDILLQARQVAVLFDSRQTRSRQQDMDVFFDKCYRTAGPWRHAAQSEALGSSDVDHRHST